MTGGKRDRERERERERERRTGWGLRPNHPTRIFLREICSAAKDLPDAIPPAATYINLEKLIPQDKTVWRSECRGKMERVLFSSFSFLRARSNPMCLALAEQRLTQKVYDSCALYFPRFFFYSLFLPVSELPSFFYFTFYLVFFIHFLRICTLW